MDLMCPMGLVLELPSQVQINNLTGLPSATDQVELTVNLDADAHL